MCGCFSQVPTSCSIEHILYGGESSKPGFYRYSIPSSITFKTVPACFISAIIVPICNGENPLDPISYKASPSFPFSQTNIPDPLLLNTELLIWTKQLTSVANHVMIPPLWSKITRVYQEVTTHRTPSFRYFVVFDSVEFPILLKHVYNVGIHGGYWAVTTSHPHLLKLNTSKFELLTSGSPPDVSDILSVSTATNIP